MRVGSETLHPDGLSGFTPLVVYNRSGNMHRMTVNAMAIVPIRIFSANVSSSIFTSWV
jgi:hypothetical protein